MSQDPLESTVTVELSDTDMTRFIHFGSVVRYFEVGLRNTLEAIDVTFRDLFDRGIGLPIVNAECDYRSPMFYGDRLCIETEVGTLTESTMPLEITMTKDGDVTASGSLTVSFYDIDERRATAIPDDLRASLEAL